MGNQTIPEFESNIEVLRAQIENSYLESKNNLKTYSNLKKQELSKKELSDDELQELKKEIEGVKSFFERRHGCCE